uniref:Uncharacterized protein n=1 Tax=Romanomermis culicivorax TaxID=13658 RepID=A0A915KV28_ROMCU
MTLNKRGPRTFLQTSKCMQNVTKHCSDKCASEEEGQKMYAQCLSRNDVANAYSQSFEVFHKCVGAENPCLRLNVTTDYGNDCWARCSGQGYQNCLKGCKNIEPDTEEGQSYLQCATQMNGAHGLFWQCLQEHATQARNITSAPVAPIPVDGDGEVNERQAGKMRF